MKHLFNQTLLNYWHFALLAALISFAFYQKTIIEPVQARFYAEKQVIGTIAVSQPAYHHAAYSDWAKVVYDTAVALKNATLIQHNKFSAWYKIHFDDLPKNSALNFFQYETVVGFDETGHELTCKTAETGSGSNQHKRNLIFYLPDTPQYKTFYFKVFARKWQGNDVLSLELQDQTQLNNEIYRDFYENQSIAFWFMFVFGVGLFQIIYIGSLAWSRRKTEYLYYLAFSTVGIFYIFIARRFELGYLGELRYILTSSILAYFALIAFFMPVLCVTT